MSYSFYVAGSRDSAIAVRALIGWLQQRGHEIRFNWTEHIDHQCSYDLCDIRDRDSLAYCELAAAANADFFVGIARLGKGAHVELGVALWANQYRRRCRDQNVLLVGVEPKASVFYDHPNVRHFADSSALLSYLEGLR